MNILHSNKLKYVLLIVIVLGGLAVAATYYFTAPSKELKAILANPMANLQLTTAEEVRRFEYDNNERALFRVKPTRAVLKILYRPIGAYTKKDVYNELVSHVDKDVWNTEHDETDKYYEASIGVNASFVLALEILSYQEEDTVSLSITQR